VLTAEEYHARALSELLHSLGIGKKDLDGLSYALGINRTLWPHSADLGALWWHRT